MKCDNAKFDVMLVVTGEICNFYEGNILGKYAMMTVIYIFASTVTDVSL